LPERLEGLFVVFLGVLVVKNIQINENQITPSFSKQLHCFSLGVCFSTVKPDLYVEAIKG
jgi:hypothetical protein